ncbi:exo-beta-N-acetylmuramidase NamZ domain-containing protein [Priestia filamentosa]|uniref:exo-beta-N-acetylmuramidase NamZ family protein n=1 Tax=Priestia filamentosa TaxID=1402861 RepID=UPI00058911E3|nr:DUF1343 domain-containing protein [Priestia filamentosa]WCM17354.1 DUF1343 domain-containing protein [Priestia filamentosa]
MRKKLTLLALFLLVFSSWNTAEAKPRQKKVELGVETLFREHKDLLKGKRVGLITNPTGVDSELRSSVDLFAEDPDIELTALYGPEHGVRGDAQAGDKVDYYMDEKTGLPVYSLYGDTRKPTPEMLKNIDILVFDIQDVGARFYTYIYTMAYAMEAAKEQGIPFVVLDRPNPLGGEVVEGPVLEEEYSSFVGKYPIPLRHGMTVGELAQLFNEEFGIGADLTVVKMKKWKRSFDYDETNLPFVMPSPNMPTLETAFVYPGTGLIEGTNVSEGRGTTKPFELLGAPFINGTELSEKLNNLHLDGVKFRAASFTPSFSKHSGQLSHGVQVYVTDREKYQAVETGLHIVKTIHDLYGEEFSFNKSGNFDLLIGNSWVREELEKGTDVEDIIAKWQKDTKVFKKVRKQYLLY